MSERWWTGLTRYQWTVLLVAWLGWVFDIADTALFNFAKGPMLKELLGPDVSPGYSQMVDGRLLTVFLVGWALGGLVFGVLADKWGRTRTMILTILVYALFTGLTALCQSWEQVAVVRFITALGIGGEWACGAALIAEVFPDKARAPAAGFLQSAAAFGPVFAALVNFQVSPEHWRWLFVVGIAPALITVVIRYWVKEPERRSGSEKETRGSLRELFGHPTWRRHALIALVLGVVVIAGSANVSYWLPNLVEQTSVGLSADAVQDRKSVVTMVMHIGTLIGVLAMPWVCECIGRRPALALFMVLSPVSVWLATQASGTWQGLLLAAPFMSMFAIGISAGLVLYFPELFPARLRATGAGIAYNVSRVFAAGIPLLTARWMGAEFSVSKGVAITAIVLGLGVLVLPFATETKGKPLEV
jgi:predicted MFS family arabinose efflux permease